jgi:L-rhamnose mutarotase
MSTQIQAFRMHLKPGNEAEYARRHAQLWPEMKELLRQAGVSDYNIFLDRATGNLFAVQRVSGEGGSQDLGDNPVCRKWWDYMADLMDVNPDNSPVSVPLEQVFHLD